jgi:hypothetical protein
MAQVYFISETKLKDYTSISQNVDSGSLRQAIRTSQLINVQETLGTSLYNKLTDLVDTGDITGSTNSNYRSLLDDYVVDVVIQYSLFYALDDFIYKFMNVGLVQGFSEQGSSLDINTFKMIKNGARDRAEFFDNRLREHLFNNNNLYPAYKTSTTDGTLPGANTDGIISSIVLDTPMYSKDYDPTCCKGDRYTSFYQRGK